MKSFKGGLALVLVATLVGIPAMVLAGHQDIGSDDWVARCEIPSETAQAERAGVPWCGDVLKEAATPSPEAKPGASPEHEVDILKEDPAKRGSWR